MVIELRRAGRGWEVDVDKQPAGSFIRMTEAIRYIEAQLAQAQLAGLESRIGSGSAQRVGLRSIA